MRRVLIVVFLSVLIAACAAPATAPTPTIPPPTATAPPTETPSPTATPAAAAAPAYGAADTAPASLTLSFADGAENAVTRTVDGNALRLNARLGTPATAATGVSFTSEGIVEPLGACEIAAGASECSVLLRADGWAWDAGNLVGERAITAATGDGAMSAQAALTVAPKPLVLVHGLNSDHTSWIHWTEPGGYLEPLGLPGYAVDDGQFGTGKMSTGNTKDPLAPTKSVQENAAVLADYVEAVRRNTGAERVDLVAHSLGGLISRYYVQNLMPVVSTSGLPDVPVANQLFMAGTPNGGTVCGRIPAALGFLSPATTQITPEYMSQVFNASVLDRRGVPFFGLAGDAVQGAIALRCTGLPTDQVVSVDSVLRGVSVQPDRISGVHTDLNNGRPAFERILKSIARAPGDYPITMPASTEPLISPPDALVQSTLVQGGTLQAGETMTLTIPVDQARSASFILYAPGSAVSMTIKTVAGAILTEETPRTNPNVTFERMLDDALPLSLGYGVVGPRAGAWDIGLTARETPKGGGPFALVATLDTDLMMTAEAAPATVPAGSPVTIRATLQAAEPWQEAEASAQVSRSDARTDVETVALFDDGAHDDGAAGDGAFAGIWTPADPAEYTVVVSMTGTDAAGAPFERLSVLGVAAE